MKKPNDIHLVSIMVVVDDKLPLVPIVERFGIEALDIVIINII